MREMLILILGLAVIAVILRGLYLALQARRGQIRLAIDKNIPHDVDLDDLEMAELPSGGARVVRRSLDEVNRQNIAQDELDLGSESEDSGPIPILMDSVELNTAQKSDSAEQEYVHQPLDASQVVDQPQDDFDAPEVYEDDYQGVEVEQHDLAEVDQGYGDDYQSADEYETEAEEEAEQSGAAHGDDQFDFGNDQPDRQEPGFSLGEEFEKELEEFSITAGERIGTPESVPATQQVPVVDNEAGTGRAAKAAAFFGRLGDKVSRISGDSAQDHGGHHQHLSLPEEPEEPGSPAEDLEEGMSWDLVQDNSVADSAKQPESSEVTDINQAKESRRSSSSGLGNTVPSEVLVINVMSPGDELFHGNDLLQVLITAGLKYGEMEIFHKHMENSNEGPVVFSVANILNPGTFDLNNMNEFSTRGVSLFLSMPAAIANLEAFEQMLTTAQQIRGALDGDLKDDHRNVMTSQTIEHYRQRIHDFELRKLKAAQAQS